MAEFVSGNIFIRVPDAPMRLGETVIGHRHNFDHTTYCPRGRLKVERLRPAQGEDPDNPQRFDIERIVVIEATALRNWILILAGTWHRLTALEDGTVYHCIYSHREPPDGAVVEQWTGWEKAVI